MVTAFGVVAAAAMVVTYALEARDRRWIAAFAVACAATATYALATDAWLFAVLEFVWAAIALRRFRRADPDSRSSEREIASGGAVTSRRPGGHGHSDPGRR